MKEAIRDYANDADPIGRDRNRGQIRKVYITADGRKVVDDE